jgi:hypothetical protein
MRLRACLVLAAAVVLSAAPAGLGDEQKALVDKAIKAMGGEEKLKKLDGMTLKGKGTFHVDNMDVPFSFDGSSLALDRFRLDLEATVNGMQMKVLLVFQGAKGWAKVNERVEEAPAEVCVALGKDTYALRLAQRLLPLKSNDTTLAPMGEIQVAGRAAIGVKATAKDRPEVNLYFDKETNLLARIDLQVQDMPGGGEVTHEFLFSEPKEMNGLKHFTKVILNRDGKKLMEIELSEVKGEDKLEASLFDKP